MGQLTEQDVKRIKSSQAKKDGGQIKKGSWPAKAESIVTKRDQQKRGQK